METISIKKRIRNISFLDGIKIVIIIFAALAFLGNFMPGKCEICGKSVQFGYRISHAHNKSKKIWHPNIQRIRAVVNGHHRRVSICTTCLRSERVVKVS